MTKVLVSIDMERFVCPLYISTHGDYFLLCKLII
jgi:hypothetical protein